MNLNTSPWVCIARTGTFADSSGHSHTFTEEDLENIRTNYNPAQSEAPLVFGHPKDNEPAYGWVQKLKCEGTKLFAQFAHVPSTVKQLVAEQRYKYVSMSLSADKKRLLHVGLLGAAAPAIDGLGAIALKNEHGIIINFSQPNEGAEKMELSELQKQLGALTATNSALQSENEQLKTKLAEVEKGKTDAETTKAEAEKKAEATVAEFTAFKNKLSTEARANRIGALVNAGKLEPNRAQEVIAFASALAEVKTPVNFSVNGGKVEEISAEEHYLRELEKKEQDPRFTFSAPAQLPGHTVPAVPTYSPSDIASKL